MGSAFDPYYTWLGIAAKDQPANHYRLLGIDPLEANPTVIEHAADQRMAHLRSLQTGKHAALSQKLLNEIAAARVCLLNPQKKAAYDAKLREKLAEPAEEESTPQPGGPQIGAIVVDESRGAQVRQALRRKRSSPTGMMIGVAAVGGVIVIGLVIWLAGSGRKSSEPGASGGTPSREVAQAPHGSGSPPAAKHAPSASPPGETAQKEPPHPGPKEAPAPKPPVQTQPPPNPPAKPDSPEGPPSPPPKPPEAEPASPPVPEKPERLPAPDAAEQERAVKLVREVYQGQYAKAKTAADWQALAAKLIAQAAAAQGNPADRFAILREAREVAVKGENAKQAFDAIDRLAEVFTVDAPAMKAEALGEVARSARSRAAHKAVAEQATSLAGDLLAADSLTVAEEVSKLALSEAGKARDRETLVAARTLNKDVQAALQAAEEVQTALATLEDHPDDPAANLAAGRYHCFIKGDWNKGLPHLAKGSDPKLAALAREELTTPPQDTEGQLKLADAWWDLAQQSRGRQRENLLLRAGTWYREAEPRAQAGLVRVKIEKRLAQIAALGREIPDKLTGPPLAVAPFDSQRAKEIQARWAKHLKVPVVRTNSIGMKLVLIPPGEFAMGATKEEVARLLEEVRQRQWGEWQMERIPYQAPQHRVRITKPFSLGLCELTQAQYQRVMEANPSQFREDPNCPMEQVTWSEAVEFCRRLSELPGEKEAGAAYRLPTEAEWEYACRAGTITPYSFGADPAVLGEYAWWLRNAQGRTHPVGRLRPNAWGLLDMHGNVAEWCIDWFDSAYYATSPVDDPTGPTSGSPRAVRGLAWQSGCPPIFCCPFRYPVWPDARQDWLGFRVARTLR